jgi:hypothetical protein
MESLPNFRKNLYGKYKYKMNSSDQLLIEQAYYQILTEQQRLIEEGKVLDFIKGMGNKLKNAFDIVNTKVATSPKLLKTLAVAGPILIALSTKNFDNLSVSSDTVKDLLDTLNKLDPNISIDDLSSALTTWDKEHLSMSKFSNNADGGVSGSDLEIGKGDDGTYSFSGSTVDTTDAEGSEVSPSAYIQTSTQQLESLVTSDLKNVFTDFTCEVIKSSNVDGSGGSLVVEYSGTVTASSDEEAIKLITELIKNGIKQSGIDISTLKMYTPDIAVSEQYIIDPAEYLIELSLVNRVSTGIKSLKTGAQELANRIKGAFSKRTNASEQRYKFTLKVEI